MSDALDGSDAMGAAAYTLEVSSRGVDRPLTEEKHWRRNRGRLVKVCLADGSELTGRIVSVDGATVRLDVDNERELARTEVAKALVQVELNRRLDDGEDDEDADEDAVDADDADGDDEQDEQDEQDDEQDEDEEAKR